jgi:DNA repair protein RadD
MTCDHCGHEWPQPKPWREPKHAPRSDDIAMMSHQHTWLPVRARSLYRHQKLGSVPTLRIVYHTPKGSCSEWLALQHGGFALTRARERWHGLGGLWPPPATVDEALARGRELRPVSEIAVRWDGRFFVVIGHRSSAGTMEARA